MLYHYAGSLPIIISLVFSLSPFFSSLQMKWILKMENWGTDLHMGEVLCGNKGRDWGRPPQAKQSQRQPGKSRSPGRGLEHIFPHSPQEVQCYPHPGCRLPANSFWCSPSPWHFAAATKQFRRRATLIAPIKIVTSANLKRHVKFWNLVKIMDFKEKWLKAENIILGDF